MPNLESHHQIKIIFVQILNQIGNHNYNKIK